jgi:predicted dehydrogenase
VATPGRGGPGEEQPLCSAGSAAADVALVERIVRVGNGKPERPTPPTGPGVAALGAGWAASVHGPIAAGLGAPVRIVASRTARSAERQAWAHRAGVATFDDLDIAADDTRGDVVLRTASGVEAVVVASWHQAEGEPEVVDAVIEGSPSTLRATLEPKMSIAVDRGRIGGWARKNGYLQQLDAFLGDDWDGLPTAETGRDVLEVLCAAYASAAQDGAPLSLPFDGPRDRTPRQLWQGG